VAYFCVCFCVRAVCCWPTYRVALLLRQFDASAYVGHWVRDLFAAHTLIEVHAAELAPPLLERAARLFPGSSFVLSLVAQAKYAMRGARARRRRRRCGQARIITAAPARAEYMEAESMFARIREGDRMRIDQARAPGALLGR
jgi:hypothetical protein